MRTGWDLSFSNSYNVPRAGAATVPRPTIILPEHCEEILARECGPAEVMAEAAPDVADEGCCCATGAHTQPLANDAPRCVLTTTALWCSALPRRLPRALPAAAGSALVLRPQLHEQGDAQLP